MTLEDMIKATTVPHSVTPETNELQWYKECAARLHHRLGMIQWCTTRGTLEDIPKLFEAWRMSDYHE